MVVSAWRNQWFRFLAVATVLDRRVSGAMTAAGRSAARSALARSGGLLTRDRSGPWRSRISDAPLRCRSRCIASGTHDTDRSIRHSIPTIQTALLVPAAHFAPGVLHLCFTHPETRGGRSAEKRSGACEAPVGHAITRRVRRLRGALRPMTQQYTGGNNVTISTPDDGSVPIVSQTEIEPITTALSLLFALVTTTALTEPPPVPKPPGPGGSYPHGYIPSGSFCTPSQGAADAITKPPNGSCPWGWIASGSYRLRNGRARP